MKRLVSMMVLALFVMVGHIQAREERELTREEKKKQCRNTWTVCYMLRLSRR